MKYSVSIMTILLFLAGTAVWAGAGACPAPCPAPCPPACTPVCGPVCPPEPVCEPVCAPVCPPVCPCPAAVPAALGAGPAGGLAGLECPDFDPAYAQKMYEQNSVIIAVTQFGAQNATDKNLRAISREINGYMTSANDKLAGWFGCCVELGADCPRAEAIIAELSSECECFDSVYAKTLSTLLKQSTCAEDLGAARNVTGVMKQQADFLAKREAGWTFRLDRWLTDHGYA